MIETVLRRIHSTAVSAHPPAYSPKDGADFQKAEKSGAPSGGKQKKLFPIWNLQTSALAASGSFSEFAGCYRQRGISAALKIYACAAQSWRRRAAR
jgi:hypothetical protein